MRSLSAAIVVAVAAALLVVGAFVTHDDTALFIQIVGCIVGVVGLGGWLVTLRSTKSCQLCGTRSK